MYNCSKTAQVLMASAVVLACTTSALAGGGKLLPASARPKGYSLRDMAVATAVYNTGITSGNPSTPPPPYVPFEVLVGDTIVKPGTMIYLPIFFIDDSGGAPPGFPADLSNQAADAAYLDGQAFASFGVSAFIVQVDGETTILNDAHVAGVTTAQLLDGTPAGTHYIISAAFLTPLSPGAHVVAIGGIVDGAPVAFLTYRVKVR